MASRSFLFQFHKGTIRTSTCWLSIASFSRFQFHKGTIRTRQLGLQRPCEPNFNSIKVQLEPMPPITLMTENRNFNSIKVQLELTHKNSNNDSERHFNSIKVQLEHQCQEDNYYLFQFQFHKGTIRTDSRGLK